MPRILLILSAVLVLGAAVLGFLNKNKLSDTRQIANDNAQKLAAVRETLSKTQKEVSDKTAALAAETAKVAEKDTALAQLQSQLDAAKQAVTEAQAQLTEKTAALEVSAKELEEMKTKAAAAPPADATPGPEIKELENKVAAIESEKKVLADKLVSSESKVEELTRDVARRKAAIMAQGLEGKIVAVNAAWGFVVLNVGDRNGIVNNADMVVMRDGERVGKVRITSVEPGRAVADIDARSLASGQSVLPGDRVIYTGN